MESVLIMMKADSYLSNQTLTSESTMVSYRMTAILVTTA